MLPVFLTVLVLLLVLAGGGWYWLSSRDADSTPTVSARAFPSGNRGGADTGNGSSFSGNDTRNGRGARPAPTDSAASSRGGDAEDVRRARPARTITETSTAVVTTTRESDGDGSTSGGGCERDPDARAIEEATAAANAKYAGSWSYQGESNYDTCSPLTFAVLHDSSTGGNTLVLMFHEGEYLGVDSNYPQRARSITGITDGFIVEYTDFEGDDDAVEFVEFRWDGSEVTQSGRIPNTSQDTLD